MMKVGIVLMLLGVGWSSWIVGASAGTRVDARTVPPVNAGQDTRSVEKEREKVVMQEISTELLQGAIHRYLEHIWSQKVKTITVSVLDPAEPTPVPSGIVELQVLPTGSDDGLGRRVFHLSVAVAGKAWKTIQVLADVSAMVDAIVPARLMKTEELIDEGDLKITSIRIHQWNHPFLTDRDEVIGKSAARPLPPDTPLRAAFIKLPLVVKKGDRVLIEARRGGLSIQTYGITKSSGQVGQTIMVANLDSGRELRAKVVAPSLVQVEF
ncbi:MAG: flagellar basal body P-ring formation chaperone FlgA [Nitrospira sp.]|nr:flagellar basal body P-ring formation chaperone FlgA [Nitrospira sp.]MDH4302515.1 flagellar basal body P-ring formation chaperone FlgA [Nitrospira sp.]MDH5192359.1 flagellar basal body P-ring formation chaperone FlgA [Nitrospira sp.]